MSDVAGESNGLFACRKASMGRSCLRSRADSVFGLYWVEMLLEESICGSPGLCQDHGAGLEPLRTLSHELQSNLEPGG